MTKHLSEIDLKLIAECEKSGFTTQMTSSLLFVTTKKKWLSSQIDYILNRATKKILKDGIPDCKLSSASKLINYLDGEDDVTFVTLTDTYDKGILIRTKRKGRPSKEEVVLRKSGVDSYEEIVKSLKLTGTPEILLACAWMTDSELRQLQMFPEVWYADVTNQTNNEKRQLLVLAGKNGLNQGFTGMRVFLPSEQFWVFDWFFNTCLIQMLKPDLIKRNKIVITDCDPNLYDPLRVAQSISQSAWYLSQHKLCQFHLLCQPWHLHIVLLAQNNSNKLKILEHIYKWLSSWFHYIETIAELNNSVTELFMYMRSSEVVYSKNTSIKKHSTPVTSTVCPDSIPPAITSNSLGSDELLTLAVSKEIKKNSTPVTSTVYPDSILPAIASNSLGSDELLSQAVSKEMKKTNGSSPEIKNCSKDLFSVGEINIITEFIQTKLLHKKLMFARCFYMETRHFEERTTNLVEQQNSANKVGFRKTKPSLSLANSAKKMTMKSRATHIEKDVRYCMNVDKSNLWSNSTTAKEIINNIEGLITQFWIIRDEYYIIQISKNQFWILSKLFTLPVNPVTKFERVREVTIGETWILYSCCCFEQNGYPCTHIMIFLSEMIPRMLILRYRRD